MKSSGISTLWKAILSPRSYFQEKQPDPKTAWLCGGALFLTTILTSMSSALKNGERLTWTNATASAILLFVLFVLIFIVFWSLGSHVRVGKLASNLAIACIPLILANIVDFFLVILLPTDSTMLLWSERIIASISMMWGLPGVMSWHAWRSSAQVKTWLAVTCYFILWGILAGGWILPFFWPQLFTHG
jgi:hypothetical protein